MANKYYKTRIVVEVLSVEPYDFNGLESLAYDAYEGDVSAVARIEAAQELSREEMAEALEEQGSDPEFLLGDEDDEDDEDEVEPDFSGNWMRDVLASDGEYED